VKNFTFDFTGHLLHLHTPYTKKLIRKLLNNQFYSCVRKAFIYSNKTTTPYPFQASTFGLPESVIDDCVLGVFDRHLSPIHQKDQNNFLNWSKETFGEGITRHFMKPYTEKLYHTPAHAMTPEWCGSFVPTPKLEEVINGALKVQKSDFGYNTTFLYPRKGGIQVLAQSLSKRLSNIQVGTAVKKVFLRRKEALLTSGETIKYDYLVNTIPLKNFMDTIADLPSFIRRDSKKLKSARNEDRETFAHGSLSC
jgi:protoporphyrinogen oxidase